MTKQIAGCKSDVLDCQWIWQLLSYRLLRGAFRPGDAVCPLRAYVRQAKRLIEDRARCVQHMQKALTEMNIRLDSVLADIMGQTGQQILRAIIGGERDPQRLASFRHRQVKASGDTIAASLEGTWREEHVFALEQGGVLRVAVPLHLLISPTLTPVGPVALPADLGCAFHAFVRACSLPDFGVESQLGLG